MLDIVVGAFLLSLPLPLVTEFIFLVEIHFVRGPEFKCESKM